MKNVCEAMRYFHFTGYYATTCFCTLMAHVRNCLIRINPGGLKDQVIAETRRSVDA